MEPSQMMANIICVAPARVFEIWRDVEPLLKSAIDRTRLSAWQPIADDILRGKSLLWLCKDGERILCAGATSLQKTDFGMVCVITACGGTDMRRWVGLLDRVEIYAKAEGCRCIRIFGRRGWSRVLEDDGYAVQSVVLEKEIA